MRNNSWIDTQKRINTIRLLDLKPIKYFNSTKTFPKPTSSDSLCIKSQTKQQCNATNIYTNLARIRLTKAAEKDTVVSPVTQMFTNPNKGFVNFPSNSFKRIEGVEGSSRGKNLIFKNETNLSEEPLCNSQCVTWLGSKINTSCSSSPALTSSSTGSPIEWNHEEESMRFFGKNVIPMNNDHFGLYSQVKFLYYI